MSFIGRHLESLALENMAKMATAVVADHFSSKVPPDVVVKQSNSTGDGVVKSRPATAGIKLGLSSVQRSATADTLKDTGIWVELVVFASARQLGAFVAQHAELLGVQLGLPLAVALGDLIAMVVIVNHVVAVIDIGDSFFGSAHC